MIEVAVITENRELNLVQWPVTRMTIMDGALCLLNNDGDTMLASYAEGTWETARLMGEDEDVGS